MATDYMDSLRVFELVEPKSAKLAHLAFEKLATEKLPPYPDNYNLWYTYYAGHQPDLTRVIDRLRDNGQPFTPIRCEELAKRFFHSDAEAATARSVNDKTQKAISDLLKTLKGSLSNAGRHKEAVESLKSGIDDELSIQRLKTIIETIIAESKTIISEQEGLRSQLDQTSKELAALRANLASAQRQAETDALTGIANRRAFDQTLSNATEEAMRTAAPLSLVLTDIDHFKTFNDAFGHPVGDQVIKLVARLLAQTTEGRGSAARYGGEEFAIVLPQCDLKTAAALAETIRKSMASKQISGKEGGSSYGTVTLSLGVSQYIPGEALSGFVNRSDKALYKAKETGRNRVVAFDRDDA